MRTLKIIVGIFFIASMLAASSVLLVSRATFAQTVIPGSESKGCTPRGTVLGLPTWYRHLDGVVEKPNDSEASTCQIKIKGLNDTWKIVAALTEALLRIASLVAIGFVVYGGINYILSQGAPDKTKSAQATVINALVGLAITIVASAVVGFIAGRF